MRRILNWVSVVSLTLVTVLGGVKTASADFTFTVAPSSAPNAFGSPSWGPYVANALNSLQNGSGSTGDLDTDPTAYEVTGAVIELGDVVVSGFSSWRGVAGQPSPFNGEYGNRLHFGLRITGGGSEPQFRLNDLAFDMSSGDSGNSLVFAGNFAGFNYSATRYGIDYGADRMPGGGDDTVYNSGNGLSLVDEIVYVGVGNAFDASFEPGPTDQDKLDSVFYYIDSESPFNIACTYTLFAPDGVTELGGAGARVMVPGPASCALLGGLLVIAKRRRR